MTLGSLKKRLARPASLIVLDGGLTREHPADASWFGRVNLALADEEWPTADGAPMTPVAQLNLREAPHVPQALADISLLTVFFGPDVFARDTDNGDGWLVRAYPSLDALRAIDTPPALVEAARDRRARERPIRAVPIRYESIEADFPDWDDVPPDLDVPEAIADEWYDHFGAHEGSKLGGWPKLIQGEVYWAPMNEHPANPEFVFQLDSMPKANFALDAGGMCYVGRGTGDSRDVWTLTTQMQ